MWWQNSDPQSQIGSTSFALTSPNERDFLAVESLHAKIALLEKKEFKRKAYFAKRLAKSHSAKQEMQDQLTRALARADQFEKREKQIDAERTKAINTANCAKRDADKIRQKHVTEFNQMYSLIATLEQQLQERDRDHRARVTSHQSTHRKMEIQLAQMLVAKQAELAAKLNVKKVAHEHSVKVHQEATARYEATLAERATEIIELKKCSRDAEIKIAQSRDDHRQLAEQQVLAIAEMQSIIATLQQSVSERDAAIDRQQSCFSEQANRILESENAHSESEKQSAFLTEKHYTVTAEFEAMMAMLQQSVAERDATIHLLEAKLTEFTNKFVELERLRCDAEVRDSQSQDFFCDSQREHARLNELQAGATVKIKKTTAAYEESIRSANRLHGIVEAQNQQLAHFQNTLEETLQAMNAAKIAQISAESQVHQCEDAISDLHEKTTQLQYRLQREAAGRRKAEAAMKHVAGATNGDSASRIVAVQFETEQRLDQLTKELRATRGLCRILQSRANAKVEKSLNEIPSNQPVVVQPRRAG